MKRLLLVCTIFALCCGCEKSTLNEEGEYATYKKKVLNLLTTHTWTNDKRYFDGAESVFFVDFFCCPITIWPQGYDHCIDVDGFYYYDNPAKVNSKRRVIFFFKIESREQWSEYFYECYSDIPLPTGEDLVEVFLQNKTSDYDMIYQNYRYNATYNFTITTIFMFPPERYVLQLKNVNGYNTPNEENFGYGYLELLSINGV